MDEVEQPTTAEQSVVAKENLGAKGKRKRKNSASSSGGGSGTKPPPAKKPKTTNPKEKPTSVVGTRTGLRAKN